MNQTGKNNVTRVRELGMSAADFRCFLINQGYSDELSMRINPVLVIELMDNPIIWQEYVSFAENRAMEKAA